MVTRQFFETRTDFVKDNLQRVKNGKGRKVLDGGFLGEYDEARVHNSIIAFLDKSDQMLRIDANSDGLTRYVNRQQVVKKHIEAQLDYQAVSIFDDRLRC